MIKKIRNITQTVLQCNVTIKVIHIITDNVHITSHIKQTIDTVTLTIIHCAYWEKDTSLITILTTTHNNLFQNCLQAFLRNLIIVYTTMRVQIHHTHITCTYSITCVIHYIRCNFKTYHIIMLSTTSYNQYLQMI